MEELTSATSTVTPELAAAIQAATAALPTAHLAEPIAGESFETPEQALLRLQDWAFTQGFAVVVESRRSNHTTF